MPEILCRLEERGKSFAISTFVPRLGPAVGPILGVVTTDAVGWRWLFWSISIFDTLLVALAFFIFKETFELVILSNKAKDLLKTSRSKGISIRSSTNPT